MKKTLAYISVALSLTACTSGKLSDLIPDNRPDYKTSQVTNPLEVPPDLTHSSIDDGRNVAMLTATDKALLSDYRHENSSKSKAEQLKNALKNIHSDGNSSWIALDADPDTTFEKVKEFWIGNGLALKRVDKNIGIMETDWLEKKSSKPKSGISSFLASVINGLTDDGERDKFRTRIDYNGKQTLIYITHYGVSEQEVDANGKIVKSRKYKDASNDFVWVSDKRKPDLEIEMLRRLNVFLQRSGAKVSTAKKTGVSVKMAKLSDNTPILLINGDFNTAWRTLGISLDRAGFEINAQNRQTGLYNVAKVTRKKVGFIIKRTETEIDSYQIGLADRGQQQIVVVRLHEGKKPSTHKAQEVLRSIEKSINN